MLDKIKAFFTNKITKVVAWIFLGLDLVVLFLGGASNVEVNNFVELVGLALGGIAAIVAFICERVKNKK